MLTRLMDQTPVDLDLTYIAQYSPKQGIKVRNHCYIQYGLTLKYWQIHPEAEKFKLVWIEREEKLNL